jgi:hypothetical protein
MPTNNIITVLCYLVTLYLFFNVGQYFLIWCLNAFKWKIGICGEVFGQKIEPLWLS